MSKRILPEYGQAETPDLHEAVFQALGAASVSWEPMDCTGVFMGERAQQIGNELLGIIAQWCDMRDCQARP
jgi:hypothetical protein